MKVSIMTGEERPLLKVLSILLHYPDEELLGSLAKLKGALRGIVHSRARTACQDFLAYLDTTPLIHLQNKYSQTFNFDPAVSLYLAYSDSGAGIERGTALVHLHQLYKTSGYETTSEEYADYLPLMLDFLSICPQVAYMRILTDFGDRISALAEHLHHCASPYASLFEALSLICKKCPQTGDQVLDLTKGNSLG